MAETATKLTLEEFLRLPETEPATELVHGVPCQKPVGKPGHSWAQTKLLGLLLTFAERTGGTVWGELGVRFSETPEGNLRVPDVSYYGPETDVPPDDYPEGPPLLAAEVRSPGQSLRSQRERLSFLRDQGTRITLLVDPESRTIEVHDGDRHETVDATRDVELRSLSLRFPAATLFR